ncbi:Tyrosine recombinase XerC [subsurface metagenome]
MTEYIERQEDLHHIDLLQQMFDSLSPANQRLVKELIMNLQPSSGPSRFNRDFGGLIPLWAAHLIAVGRSPGTVRVYTGHVLGVLSEFPHPTVAHLDAHLAARRARGQSASYLNIRISALKTFFSFCLERGYSTSDPTIHMGHLKIPLRETKSPPRSDLKRLLSLVTETVGFEPTSLMVRDRALLCILADGGLRLDEIRHITMEDIGSDSVMVVGKGNKQRTVYLSSPAMKAIASLKKQLPAGEHYLFRGRYPGTPWSCRAIEDRLDHLCSEAGIERITPHQLRHYFATEMLNDGASLKAVSDLLGHNSTDITARVYWHILSRQKKREHQRHSPLRQLQRRAFFHRR